MTETFKQFKKGFLAFMRDYTTQLTDAHKKVLLNAAKDDTGIEKEQEICDKIATLGISPEELAAQMFIKNILHGTYVVNAYFYEDNHKYGCHVYPLPGKLSQNDIIQSVLWFHPNATKVSIGSCKLTWDAKVKGMETIVTKMF